MASHSSPELRSILILTHDIVTALSNDPLGAAGMLLGKELISIAVHSRVLHYNGTPYERAAFLVEAVRNTIETAPLKFHIFLEILSEQTHGSESVAETLRTTYQSELLVLTSSDSSQ